MTVGIGDHAQRALGGAVLVEPTEVGKSFAAGYEAVTGE
ncbi:hypothetical protein WN990_27400 [Kitasatospora purpeofusca]